MNTFENSKVLITGGFGFIGSHLVKRLMQNGAEIHIITMPNTNKFRLHDNLSEISCYETDICNTIEVNNIIKTIKPDYVFHMASYGINAGHTDPYKATYTNVSGSVNIMTSLCEIGCKKFINIGTCAEYGNGRTDEDMPPAPVNIYGSTKAAATIVLHQIARENGISIVTLRPFGVFGEGEDTHKIFCHVISNVLRERDVPLSQCEQYRDYCYVENIVDAMLLACEREDITNEIFNVASGEAHTLKYFVDLIFEHMETDKKPLYGEIAYRKTELWRPKADITKIKTILNWEVKISLEEGIVRTINWYKNNLHKFFPQVYEEDCHEKYE